MDIIDPNWGMFFLFKVALPCICIHIPQAPSYLKNVEFVHLDQEWKDVVIAADLTSQGQGRASSND